MAAEVSHFPYLKEGQLAGREASSLAISRWSSAACCSLSKRGLTVPHRTSRCDEVLLARFADLFEGLFQPYPADLMQIYPVSLLVNNVRNESDVLAVPQGGTATTLAAYTIPS